MTVNKCSRFTHDLSILSSQTQFFCYLLVHRNLLIVVNQKLAVQILIIFFCHTIQFIKGTAVENRLSSTSLSVNKNKLLCFSTLSCFCNLLDNQVFRSFLVFCKLMERRSLIYCGIFYCTFCWKQDSVFLAQPFPYLTKDFIQFFHWIIACLWIITQIM